MIDIVYIIILHAVEKNFCNLPSSFKDQMKSCYQLHEVTCCDDPLNQFPADSLEQCEQYCQFSDHCNYLVYKSEFEMCTLLEILPAPTEKNEFTTIGNITCVRSVQRTLEAKYIDLDKMRNEIKKHEVLITDGDTRKCLEVSKTLYLKWGACLDTSFWIVNWIDYIQVRIKHKDSNNCMEAQPFQDGSVIGWTVVLRNCSQSFLQTFELIVLMHSSTSGIIEYVTLEMTSKYQPIAVCPDCKGTLQDLVFDTIQTLREPCHKGIQIDDGKVVETSAAPFYLPGSNITVACNPGYETREHNNATTYQFTCLNNFIKATAVPRTGKCCFKLSLCNKHGSWNIVAYLLYVESSVLS